VIGTDVGSIPELIEHGRTGFVCPSAQPKYICAVLNEAWTHRSSWERMAREANAAFKTIYPAAPEEVFLGLMT
jgi:glycosyltransferase involved in cell wall biosynthesis